MNQGKQSITIEYRWGVVDASEPSDIRTVRGYVSILEHQSPADSAVVTYKLMFFDVNGLPIQSFPSQDFLLLASAAALAMAEVEEESAAALEHYTGPPLMAALVPLAT